MNETAGHFHPPISDEQLLHLATFFEGKFSIDWIQALSEAKATSILKTFDRFSRKGILKKHDLGIFSFTDSRKKRELLESLPLDWQETLRRRIADLLMNDDGIKDGLPQAAAQLLNVPNNLEGCGQNL